MSSSNGCPEPERLYREHRSASDSDVRSSLFLKVIVLNSLTLKPLADDFSAFTDVLCEYVLLSSSVVHIASDELHGGSEAHFGRGPFPLRLSDACFFAMLQVRKACVRNGAVQPA